MILHGAETLFLLSMVLRLELGVGSPWIKFYPMDHMKTKWILVWMVHVRVSACCARGSLLPCLLPAQYPHKMGIRCGEATACDGVVCISSWDGCQAKEHFFLSIGHVSLAICSFLSSFWIVFLCIFIFHLLVEKDSYILLQTLFMQQKVCQQKSYEECL